MRSIRERWRFGLEEVKAMFSSWLFLSLWYGAVRIMAVSKRVHQLRRILGRLRKCVREEVEAVLLFCLSPNYDFPTFSHIRVLSH